MQELTWLQSHIGSMEQAIELLNSFHWNLSVRQQGDQWHVLGGDQVIFRSNQREAVDAFLYGLALPYATLPAQIASRIKEELISLVK